MDKASMCAVELLDVGVCALMRGRLWWTGGMLSAQGVTWRARSKLLSRHQDCGKVAREKDNLSPKSRGRTLGTPSPLP